MTQLLTNAATSNPALWVMATGSGGAELTRVRDPGVQLAWWQRPADDALVSCLGGLADEELPHLRLVAPVADLADTLRAEVGARAWRCGPLLQDVADLARLFAAIAGITHLLVRLERIAGDACCRWHTDQVSLRLLCTYRGPTTLLARPEAGRHDAHGCIVSVDEAATLQPRRLDVLILKGQRFGDGTPPTVHRSPALAGTCRTRLLLALDPADDG